MTDESYNILVFETLTLPQYSTGSPLVLVNIVYIGIII